MRNDPDNGLIAGRCKCKENVAGARCQRCEAGYWDLSMDGCRGNLPPILVFQSLCQIRFCIKMALLH